MDPFIGELRLFPYNFAPRGWASCNGQLLPIAQYTALFSLLGTNYGGNGTTTFPLPGLRGRAPIGVGPRPRLSQRSLGGAGGAGRVTLTAPQVAAHTHAVTAPSAAASKSPSGALPAYPASESSYGGLTDQTMSNAMIKPNAGGQPHDNMPPYLVMTWCIALIGIFPSRD